MKKSILFLFIVVCLTATSVQAFGHDYVVSREGVCKSGVLDNGVSYKFSNITYEYSIKSFDPFRIVGELHFDAEYSETGRFNIRYFRPIKYLVSSEYVDWYILQGEYYRDNGSILEVGLTEDGKPRHRDLTNILGGSIFPIWHASPPDTIFTTDYMLPEHSAAVREYIFSGIETPVSDAEPEISFVYPNLVINGMLQDAKLSIYDILGRKAISKEIDGSSTHTEIDCSALEKGVYVVVIEGKSQIYKRKISIP